MDFPERLKNNRLFSDPRRIYRLFRNPTHLVDVCLEHRKQAKESKRRAKEFDIFMEKTEAPSVEPLQFYKLVYPFQDFTMVFGKQTLLSKFQNAFDQLGGRIGLNRHNFRPLGENHCYMLSTLPVEKREGIDYVFSGLARTDSKLIYGVNDINSDLTLDIRELQGSIGDHFIVFQDARGIQINADYFGVTRMYYCEIDNVFFVSNRYHLLLLTLAELNIKMEVNWSKIYAELCRDGQLVQQMISRDMDVEGIYMVPPDKKIVLSKNGAQLGNTPLHDELYHPEEYDAERYKELLYKAKDELIDNARIALESPHFEHVRIDLTGGMDSRMVYAAALKFPEYRDKICLLTNPVPNNPREFEVSMAVNNLYGYPFDTVPVQSEPYYARQIHDEMASFFLGTSYEYAYRQQTKDRLVKTLRMTGSYGATCVRPYYARRNLNTDIDGDDIGKVAEKLSKQWVIADNLRPYFVEVFTKELELLPGRTPLEKLDLHYLYYRNGLHCNSQLRADYIASDWGILQSKTLFHLKYMTFQEFKSIKLQLDMTELLDSNIAAIPYELKINNEDKQLLKDVLYRAGKNPEEVPYNTDSSLWEQAAEIKKERRSSTYKNSDELDKIGKHYEAYPKEVYTKTMQILRILLAHNQELNSKAGEDLYFYLKECEKNIDSADFRNTVNRFRNVINRLWSLYYQLNLIEIL